MPFAGVDVGGVRKGFHVAVIDESGVVAGPQRLADAARVVDWLRPLGPSIVAVDSPMSCARAGERSRSGERELARAVCGIRWTPPRPDLEGNPYYQWVLNGLDLYERLGSSDPVPAWELIEVFPTASWTRWAGPRGSDARASWSSNALTALELDGLPRRRLGQDDRDAVAAAMTAMQHGRGETEHFGELVVPIQGTDPSPDRSPI